MYLKSERATECVGCAACAQVCPRQCITMEEDAEGFKYPSVHHESCISCHLCEKVCPTDFESFSQIAEQAAYVGVHQSAQTLFNSASGGAFTAIYEELLQHYFRVYGVKWGEGLKVIHDVADTREECEKFRKSKYILSDTNGCFIQVAADLRAGKSVLFCGSPCQVAALLKFTETKRVDTSNLITVDIVCHGAPNQKVFDKYLSEQKVPISEFSFRNKAPYRGQINSRSAEIKYENGHRRIVGIADDPFLQGYYTRLFYRPSCAECHFARIERCSDITIGDAWGVEEIYPEYNPLSGVSLLIVNTSKGNELLAQISSRMKLQPVELTWAEKTNSQLRTPTTMHPGRGVFFANVNKIGFSKAVRKALKTAFWKRCVRLAKRIVLKMKNYLTR